MESSTIAALHARTLEVGSVSGNVSVNWPLDLTGHADIVSLQAPSGAVTQTQPITVGTLTATSNSALTIDNPANRIAALGDISAPTLSISSPQSLAIVGTVAGQNGLTLTVNGDLALGLAGGLTGVLQTSGPALLNVTGAITEPNGAINTSAPGTLGGSVASASLTGLNAIATLGNFTVTDGDFILNDTVPLTVQGIVSTQSSPAHPHPTLAINDDLLSIISTPSIPGGLHSTDGTVALAPFTASVPMEVIATGATATPGTLSLTQAELGLIQAATFRLGSAQTGPITIGAPIDLENANPTKSNPATALDVQSAAAVTETGAGTLATPTLTGQVGSARLNGSNNIGSLGNLTAASGDFVLADVASLGVNGAVSANNVSLSSQGFLNMFGTGSVTASAPRGTVSMSANGGDLQIIGPASVRASSVDLNASGTVAVTAPSGSKPPQPSISANILTGSASSASILGQNTIANLGGFTTRSGQFAISDSVPLTIIGPVIAGTNEAVFSSPGGLTETGTGSIMASSLSIAEATGSATLNGNNAIGLLQNIRLPGDFSLTNSESLIINGLGAQNVTLNVAGAITEIQPLFATSLAGSADSVSLTGANQIGTLGSFSAPGGFALTSTGRLTIGGRVNAGTNEAIISATDGLTETGAGAITAGLLSIPQTTGGAALNGNNAVSILSAPRLPGDFLLTNNQSLVISGLGAQDATLNVTGAITERVFVIVKSLAGSADSVLLTGTNQIGSLGSFSARDSFTLVNTGGLSITGPVSSPALTLRTGGNIGIQGDVRANTLELDATGTIVRTGGALVAGTVSGSGLHLVDFGTAPQIANLGAFTVTGSEFAL
ncbi:MAG: hypothetical protein JO106_13930, partial [Mycobacterium sp.]|nr:hypothetical protein [Mycobacterium sp.]